MLGGIKLKVCYTHERNCFAYISQKHSTNKEQTQCIQVLNKDKQLLLWVIYTSSIPEGHIAFNPIYSRHIGLSEGTEVFVSPYNNVKVLDELYIDADSPDDQEILEHNAELLQLRLLDQLRLVSANQKAVVWLSVSLPIVFTPKQTGLLVNQSRVVVKVDAFNTMRKIDTSQFEQNVDEPEFKTIGLINEGMLKPYMNVPKKIVVRALPIDKDVGKEVDNPFKVFLHSDFITKSSDKDFIIATLEAIPAVVKDNNDEAVAVTEFRAQVILINSSEFCNLSKEDYNKNIPTVLIPKYLHRIINVENGVKLKLTFIKQDVESPEHIEILTYSEDLNSEIDIIDRFKSIVIENKNEHKRFIINSEIAQQNNFISNGYIKFKLKPDRLKYAILNPDSFRDCTISAKCLKENELKPAIPINSSLNFDTKSFCRNMKSMEKLIKDVMSNLYFEIHREANFKGVSEIKSNVLITGLSGSGKSSLCQIIQKEMTVWSQILHCRSLRGRKDIPEAFGKAILMCQEHSPSVLICDDVDSLIPPNVEGSSPQDIAYYQRLAVVLKHMLQSCSGVSVLMTALSVKSLHPVLRKFTGKPLFTAHYDIKELDQADRTELLNHLITARLRKEFVIEEDDVIKLSMNTAGLNVRDVTDYLNKKIFTAVKKKSQSSESRPRLVRDTDEETDNRETDVWAPIGGMQSVKQELTECIFWPLKYPALFPSQSCGILLYGPPGTGKSFIGSCVGAASGLNFIAVKGPELLSKYIGQSEKAVRDIFDKADMKKPCVLFFDEFDSLAPKRGHDSTGVTDRVVNQLLSRLDGAEGGASGPVMAATSRPDLVDPALLRAGRLQRHVYCALPDLEGRHKVLQTLSKDVSLDPEIDLEDVARRTDGFSPADLKSLLVTAQLASLETQLSNNEGKNLEAVIVHKDHIENALEETKPSLSAEQRRFYDMIYKRFRGESLNPEENVISAQFQKQRVTLA